MGQVGRAEGSAVTVAVAPYPGRPRAATRVIGTLTRPTPTGAPLAPSPTRQHGVQVPVEAVGLQARVARGLPFEPAVARPRVPPPS